MDLYANANRSVVRNLGPLPHKEVRGFYTACDLFVNPTLRHEGLDMTIQEAMLCGVPVLASDVGSISRTALPGWSYGTTFVPGDTVDLGRKLQMLINNIDLNALGRSAARYAETMFSSHRMCC